MVAACNTKRGNWTLGSRALSTYFGIVEIGLGARPDAAPATLGHGVMGSLDHTGVPDDQVHEIAICVAGYGSHEKTTQYISFASPDDPDELASSSFPSDHLACRSQPRRRAVAPRPLPNSKGKVSYRYVKTFHRLRVSLFRVHSGHRFVLCISSFHISEPHVEPPSSWKKRKCTCRHRTLTSMAWYVGPGRTCSDERTTIRSSTRR